MTSTPQNNPDCPERTLLEEYVLNRVDPDAMRRIETHLEGCGPCTALVRELKEEANSIVETLSVSRRESEGQCVSEETLALYLDRALDGDEYTQTEHHLAECEICRERLITLRLEVLEVLGEDKLPEPASSRVKFADAAKGILTKTSKQIEPKTESERRTSSADLENSEPEPNKEDAETLKRVRRRSQGRNS